MSAKEERLVLAIIPANERSETCPFCSTGEFWDMCSLYDKDGEADCDKCQEGIPRSEAVERIAKALWDRNQKRIARINKEFVITPWDTVERPSPNTQVYLENSEAALDALVEAKAPKS